MLLASTPGWLLDAAKIIGALVTVVLGLGALSRTRPARWVGKTLLADPLGEFFEARVEVVIGPRLEELRVQIHETTEARNEQVHGIHERIDSHTEEELGAFNAVKITVEDAVADFGARLASIEEKITPTEGAPA